MPSEAEVGYSLELVQTGEEAPSLVRGSPIQTGGCSGKPYSAHLRNGAGRNESAGTSSDDA